MIRSTLLIERLGPLPIINHFIARMGLDDALARHVPSDQRSLVPHARALGVLLRSIIVEREPIYRQQETVTGFAAGMFAIPAEEMEHLGDDRIGRALDRLFDADRAALLTDVVLAVGQAFALKFEELHNDSTTVSFCGAYRAAWGRKIRGRTAPAITYGRPPPRSQAAPLHPHDDKRWGDPRRVSLQRRQYQRFPHPYRDLEHIARRCWSGGLPLRRGFRAVLAREHGSYRSRRRALRHRAATQSLGGRRVSRVDPNQYARVDHGVEPPSSPLCRWTARPLVRLSRAIAHGRGLVDRLGVEHLAHPAQGGQAKEEHGRGQRGAQRVA